MEEEWKTNFVKLKSLGVSETSRTLDTRNKQHWNESSSSLMDKFSVKEKKRLFNFNFVRDVSESSGNELHLDSLRKTVNSLHWRSERKIQSRERIPRPKIKPEPERLNVFNLNNRVNKKYRKVCSLNEQNSEIKINWWTKT